MVLGHGVRAGADRPDPPRQKKNLKSRHMLPAMAIRARAGASKSEILTGLPVDTASTAGFKKQGRSKTEELAAKKG